MYILDLEKEIAKPITSTNSNSSEDGIGWMRIAISRVQAFSHFVNII